MHSLKHELNNLCLNSVKIDNPMCSENEESLNNNLSQRCNILCKGNTSAKIDGLNICKKIEIRSYNTRKHR